MTLVEHSPSGETFNVTHEDDFILQIDGFMDELECQTFIDMFHFMKGHGLVYTRQNSEKISQSLKSDTSTSLFHDKDTIDAFNLNTDTNATTRSLLNRIWEAYRVYESKFLVHPTTAALTNSTIKIQKTEPTEGYHVWHSEKDENNLPISGFRHLAWAIYLNDIDDGGETEFIHQKMRVKSKEGRLVLWPAGFTHTHRGNPPLKETKYILTGWISQ